MFLKDFDGDNTSNSTFQSYKGEVLELEEEETPTCEGSLFMVKRLLGNQYVDLE